MTKSLLVFALVVAAATGITVTTTTEGFLSCTRVGFDTIPLNADGSLPAINNQLASFGVTFQGLKPDPISTSLTGYPRDGFENLQPNMLTRFDTSKPRGSTSTGALDSVGLWDIDLGAPNINCDMPCPAQYANKIECAAVCSSLAQYDLLPAGVQCNGNYDTCPGIGCGGGRFKAVAGSTNQPPFNYQGGGLIAPTRCTLLEDSSGCPILNSDGNNCGISRDQLILQEYEGTASNPAFYADDRSAGGYIVLTFDRPVTVTSVAVTDMDEAESINDAPGVFQGFPSADLANSTGTMFVPLTEGRGDNSRSAQNFNDEFVDIRRFHIYFDGSGAVDDIEFCFGADQDVVVDTTVACEHDWTLDVTPPATEQRFVGESTVGASVQGVGTRTDPCEESDLSVSGAIMAVASGERPSKIVDIAGILDTNPSTNVGAIGADVNFDASAFTCQPYVPTMDCPFALVPAGIPQVTLDAADYNASACPATFSPVFAGNNTLTCQFTVTPLNSDPTNVKLRLEAMATTQLDGPSVLISGPVTFADNVGPSDEAATITNDFDMTGEGPTSTSPITSTAPAGHECTAPGDVTTPYVFTLTEFDSNEVQTGPTSFTTQCYGLDVAVDSAVTTLTRTFTWEVLKTGSPRNPSPDQSTDLTVPGMETGFDVSFTYTATATPTESGASTEVTFSITNNHPTADATGVSATIVGTTDGLTGLAIGAGQTETFTITTSASVGSTVQVTVTHLVPYTSAAANVVVSATEIDALTTLFADGVDAGVAPLDASGSSVPVQFGGALPSMTFAPETCLPGQDVATGEYPCNIDLRLVSGTIAAESDWVVRVTTPCVEGECGECNDPVMYPAGLDAMGCAVRESGSSKKVVLCFD